MLRKYHLGNELKFTENEYQPYFELKYKFLENLRKPLTLKNTKLRLTYLTLSIVCALARHIKIQNVYFRPGGFSYAFNEKFTALLVNFTLNFTGKTDMALIASWNSIVRQ